MITLTINENDYEQRLDKFLFKTFKNLPKNLIYKYIRKKDIKLDGKSTKPEIILKKGQVLTLYIKDSFLNNKKHMNFLKAKSELEILYEDKNFLIINKKIGVLCQPDKNNLYDSLADRLKKYLYNKKEYLPEKENSFAPALANRLDRNTCGLVLAAKNAKTLKILCEKIKNREVKKFYICLIEGYLNKKKGYLSGFILKNKNQNKSKILKQKENNAKKVFLKYKVILEKYQKSLIEVELVTGRSHQIRAQFSDIGHPLISDVKYGSKKKNLFLHHQALCSYKIVFSFKNACDLSYVNHKEFFLEILDFFKK